jgi:acyl-CoA reductase-like NAD-dependent aldehyde dehydrogenase
MTVKTIPLLINGQDKTTATKFDVINPKTSEPAFQAYGATAKEAKVAVDAAAAAFPAWSRTKPIERRALLFKAAQLVEERIAEVTELQILETCVDSGFAKEYQGQMSAGLLRECGSQVSASLQGTLPEPDEEGT